MSSQTLIKIACPDSIGLLARLTGFVAQQGGNLLEVHQYTDPMTGWFFARLAIDTKTLPMGLEELRKAFQSIGHQLNADWTIRDSEHRMRVVILVSKLDHCLVDLIWRWKSGELAMEIPVIISNHEDFREMVESEGIRFEYIPVDANKKGKAFDRMQRIFEEVQVHLVIMARYMQILPNALCEAYPGRIINIHHSFLPSFVGANPYRRAYERGVKLIGATCHYATPELDEGPIIEQEVVRVEHFHSPDDLLRLGRDCERMALARGVRYHVNDRVLIHGNKSIVFKD